MKKLARLLFIIYMLSVGTVSSSAAIADNSTVNPADSAYALIAGGSKGIGYAIAEALARRGYHLVLVARGMDSLVAAQQRLESRYNVNVEILSYDLSREETAPAITKWCTDRSLHLVMLCNVAGFGGSRDYLSLAVDSIRYMIRLNTESSVVLTAMLLPLLEKNAPSYILNVASMAGFTAIPSKNIYSATKASLIYFSYALRYQLKDKNISVSCLAPGPVFTKPEIVEETKRLGWFGMQMALTPAYTGEVAVKKMLKGRLVIVPGTLAKMTSLFIRLMPMRFVTAVTGSIGNKKKK